MGFGQVDMFSKDPFHDNAFVMIHSKKTNFPELLVERPLGF